MVYPESDLDHSMPSDWNNDDSLVTKVTKLAAMPSPTLSTPRQQTYNQFRRSKDMIVSVPGRITKHYSSVIGKD